ncbi:MAG: CfrBI family restriction endonuclease [Chloroflexi bacterium]|nr:CfrBI family restriction endonuclease [Chloroflexota bacterium]
MSISDCVTRNIIKKLLTGKDYRDEVIALIDADFLQYVVEFFKMIVDAKLKDQTIDLDWYKASFIDNPALSISNRALNAGINKKTIHNMHGSSKKEIMLDAANDNYIRLKKTVEMLIENEKDLDIVLTIKLKKLSVDLTLDESLLVINALAVKRAELRGGLWSTAGKRVERPLMIALCKLFQVPEENYARDPKGRFYSNIEISRQIDFYLNCKGNFYKCEVKLMGKGNPESADAAYARKSHIFVADTLSEKNKVQFNDNRIEWVELHTNDGYQRFAKVLDHLDIPYKPFEEKLESVIESILDQVFL